MAGVVILWKWRDTVARERRSDVLRNWVIM